MWFFAWSWSAAVRSPRRLHLLRERGRDSARFPVFNDRSGCPTKQHPCVKKFQVPNSKVLKNRSYLGVSGHLEHLKKKQETPPHIWTFLKRHKNNNGTSLLAWGHREPGASSGSQQPAAAARRRWVRSSSSTFCLVFMTCLRQQKEPLWGEYWPQTRGLLSVALLHLSCEDSAAEQTILRRYECGHKADG